MASATNGSHAAAGHFGGERSKAFDERWSAVDAYVLEHLHPPTRPDVDALRHALGNSTKHGLPDISVCPTMGKFLNVQCRALGAKRVLEVGTLGAYSTIWMASGNPEMHVTTLELDETYANVARENIKKAGLSGQIDVRVGKAEETIKDLEQEVREGKRERFDFVFIDADKVNNYTYFDHSVKMGHKGTMLVVDNVVRQGRLASAELAETDRHVWGARNLVEKVGKDKRVEATVLQLVAEKTYDGILVATVL
jgi:predicted O-methyltransferase YrrM